MCKKRLRAAIDMYECILLGKYRDGSYGGLNRTEILKKFKSRLNELELKLKPCPFCGELPIYEESCFSHHGLCSGDGGYSENIKCVQCDYIFMGGRDGGVIDQWNNRIRKSND